MDNTESRRTGKMSMGQRSKDYRDYSHENLRNDNTNKSDSSFVSRKRPRDDDETFRDRRSASRHDSDTDHHRHRRHHDKSHYTQQAPFVIHDQQIAEYFDLFRSFVKQEKSVEIKDRRVARISDLDSRELDLWKRFIRRWNAGRAGTHWYDNVGKQQDKVVEANHQDSNEEEDDFGPPIADWKVARQGPSLPSSGDLEAYLEEEDEEEDYRQQQLERSVREQHEATLDQVAPPAGDPGSKSRIMEKRMAQRAADREYRERSPDGQEVNDKELMGVSTTPANPTQKPRGISSASLRQRGRGRGRGRVGTRIDRRAVVEERERQERMEAAQVKEKKTMEMLKKLAQERFGSHG